MNFCIDCQYAVGDVERLQCGHPKNSIKHTDMAMYAVTGVKQATVSVMLAATCIAMRSHEKHPSLEVDMCGIHGKWWEKKA